MGRNHDTHVDDESDSDDELHETPSVRHEALSARQLHFDERIRTCCLVILAAAVVYTAMDMLENIIIPFVLALALKYLLTPVIETLSCAGPKSRRLCKYCRLPRFVAVVISFFLAILLLMALGIVISRSVEIFTERAPLYRDRLETILEAGFAVVEGAQGTLAHKGDAVKESMPFVEFNATAANASEAHTKETLEIAQRKVLEFMSEVSLTDAIIKLLGKAAGIAEDVMYIALFLVFMLMHDSSDHEEKDVFAKTVDRQIYVYIRGKTSISFFVAVTNGTILMLVGLDLFLAFGVLAFILNFIPNVGMFTSVLLPMPLVALDATFAPWQVGLAFVGPLLVGMFAKDVLEPIVLGKGTSLHPISVLLAIMLFGSVWGVTGMVMAVPLTAVCRIYLEAVDHPLPRYVAHALAGTRAEASETSQRRSRTELV